MYKDKDPSKAADEAPYPTNITQCYFLATAYAASLGGCGTLVGTGTNLTFKGIFEQAFPDGPSVDFLRFMAYSSSIMLIYTFLTWIWLQFWFMGMFRPNSIAAKEADLGKDGTRIANEIISKRIENLGPITTHEISVGLLFLLAIVGWIFRSPGFVTGWADAISDVKISDGTPAMLVIALMFILPEKWTFLNWFNPNTGNLLKLR